MYHRGILYAFVALLLVTVSVLITYAVTKAGDTATTTNTSGQAISMPSFMTELSTIATIESGLYESCGTEDFFYTDAEGTCCSGTNFVYWDEQFLCCEGDVLSAISEAGLTCSTAEAVMSSGDECSCPSESVAGPCIEDYDGFCCEFEELVYTDTPDGDEQWLCCGLDIMCVMEYSVLAPVPVTDNFDSSVVYFTPDVSAALSAAISIVDKGVQVESWEEFVADAFTVSEDDDWKFEQYTKAFDKTYEDEEELAYRRVVFMYNDQVAKSLDEASEQATFGWTQFSDWTTEEFQAIQGTTYTEDDKKLSATYKKLSAEVMPPIMGRRRAAAIMDKVNSRRRQDGGMGSGDGGADGSGGDDECEDDCGPEGHWSGWQCGSDKQENGCEWYNENTDACGLYDVDGFDAVMMCCACGGGDLDETTLYPPTTTSGPETTSGPYISTTSGPETTRRQETTTSGIQTTSGMCQDSTMGATDNYGDSCEWYEGYPAWCGYFDDDDFFAVQMCCACGGGITEPTAEPTEEPTSEPTRDPTRDPDAKPTSEPTEEPTTLRPTMAPVEGLNIDYVAMGMTTAVKNQGSCGSCWAFATTEVVESAMLINGTVNAGTELSEQEFVSCSTAGTCSGGWPYSAFQWILSSTNGVCSETAFPYTGADDACAVDVTTAGMSDSIPAMIWTATDWCWDDCADQYLQEESMANLLIDYGTINVNIHASTAWSAYTGGIMSYDDCGGAYATSSSGLDHAVQLVGINSEGDTPYWIVRNSWGTGWGEGGFIYLEYGTNTCGIANCPGLITV